MEFSGFGNAWALAITLGFLFLWYLAQGRKRPKKFAHLKELPGPKGLPLIGNIHQMTRVQTLQFSKWSEEFGDIYKLNLASQPVIIISDAKLSKEMFNHPALTGKPYFTALTLYENQGEGGTKPLGILNSDGTLWEVHRRFLLRQLREFGFSKSSMEQLIVEELNELLENFEKQAGTAITRLDNMFRLPVINSLWKILTSNRFKQDDPELLRLATEGVKTFNEAVSGSGLLIFMPFLRKIFPEMSGYRKVRDILDKLRTLFEKPVKEHQTNFQEGTMNDFIDVYLDEMRKTTDPQSYFYGELAERQLVTMLFDVFFAGSDTTINSLTWTFLFLCKYPEVQRKLQDEIERITDGNSRSVHLADRLEMPYAQALIEETLRHSSVIADGVAHRTLEDLEFHGYFIPKDAWVQPNLYYIHHDPKVWGEDANTFRPERFLTKSSTEHDLGELKFEKNENIQAFQVGKRVCVGQTLALDTLFLFITNIFQRFSVAFAPNSSGERAPSEMESMPGFFRSPKTFSVIMTKRSNLN